MAKERDIHNRAQQVNRAARALKSQLWSNKIRLTIKIYIGIVRPILISIQDIKKIDAVEVDFFRRACRGSRIVPNRDIGRRTGECTPAQIELNPSNYYGMVM